MLQRMEGSLQGRLLIAAPSLGDPNFAGSVVLVAEHDAGGVGLPGVRPVGKNEEKPIRGKSRVKMEGVKVVVGQFQKEVCGRLRLVG